MLLSESQSRALAERVLSKVRADSATVAINSNEQRNLRFARNGATTNGARDSVAVTVTVNLGRRSGSYRTTQIDDAGITAAVDEATRFARIAPENAEFLPPLGPQTFGLSVGYHAPSANANAQRYATMLAPVVEQARTSDVMTAGYIEGGAFTSAFATSAGLFGYYCATDFDFTVTARTNDGSGSGWQGTANYNLGAIDAAAMGRAAIDKAVRSRQPTALEPGRYTVVLESSPAADLIGYLDNGFDARAADEGRSAFSKRGGGNRIGERIVNERITLRSDPTDPIAPSIVWGHEGVPQTPVTWIENGVLRELVYSRYWAQQKGRSPSPAGTNLILDGGTKSVDDLVRSVDGGVLVTRFWYIRYVDQRTLVLTGLTRDGLFLIENGEVTRPLKNMRWNESPLAVLNNVVELGRTVRGRGTEQQRAIAAPPILARQFTFSSVSDAV